MEIRMLGPTYIKRIFCLPLITIVRAPPEETKKFSISATNHTNQGGEKYE
jgi:hypothetical protein